uniref:MYND-type domain-containing protein n=1 Tax=Caenorhabditis tropicalis TaxID=1561998 RepID=A0A1I7UTF3_9PELO
MENRSGKISLEAEYFLRQYVLEAKSSDYKVPTRKKLWDTVRTILIQLKGLGQETEMLNNLVVKKFSYAIQEDIYKAKLELNDDLLSKSYQEDRKNKKDKKKEKTSSNDSEETQRKKPDCLFCDKPQYSSKCKKITDINERVKILTEKKACKGCYGTDPKHEKSECNKQYWCKNECKDKQID